MLEVTRKTLDEAFKIMQGGPLRDAFQQVLIGTQVPFMTCMHICGEQPPERIRGEHCIPLVIFTALAICLQHGKKLPSITIVHTRAFEEEVRRCSFVEGELPHESDIAMLNRGMQVWTAKMLLEYEQRQKQFFPDYAYDLVWKIAKTGGASKETGIQKIMIVLRLFELAEKA
jgi:hypothetical protein